MNGQRNFEKYIRGVCVVENGDILRGPPRKVKVSLHHLDAPAPRWCCCCWPRTPSCDKVAKFKFNKQKSEASLQKYTSLETAMYMNGMVFQEYWKPGKAAVKVSVTQRRGKKLVLFARLTTFLDEMRDREAEQFVLYVTESGFRIITKDKTASGGEEKRAPQKKTRHASRQKGECDKREHYEKKEKIDYMTSLLTSFKEKKEEPAQILTRPEVVKLPPVIPMLAVQTNNLTASRCSPFHKEAPAAREQHATASRPALCELQPSMNRNEQQSTASRSVPREVQPSKNSKELEKKVQMVQVQGKDERGVESERKNPAEGKETAAWEGKVEKEDTNTDDVENAASETENRDKEEKDDTEKQDGKKKEEDQGIMSEVQLVQEGEGENSKSHEKNTGEEEEAPAWEDYGEDETEKVETDTGDVEGISAKKENTDKEEKDTEKEYITKKEEEPGTMSDMQLVQKGNDEDPKGEEGNPREEKETEAWEDSDEHDTGKKKDAEEVNSVPPDKKNTEDWEDYDEHDTGMQETDADELNSVPPEKEETEAWDDYDEYDTGKEETDADELNSVPPEKEETEAWDDYDEHDTGKEETDADELNSDAPEKENIKDWEEYDEQEIGKEETDAEEVNSDPPEKDDADQEDKDAAKECVSLRDKEPGIMIDMIQVQEGNDEDNHSEEEGPPGQETAAEQQGEHETKKETDAEEVNSVPAEKENTEEEETRNFEKGVEKEDLTEKVNFPSLAKQMSSTKVTVKNKPRRKIRKAMHLRKKKDSPDYKKSVSSRWRWWKTSPTTPVEKMTPAKNIGKSQNLKKKVLTCRHKKSVMGNAPPAPVRKMTPSVTAKKELDLRKKTLPCSHKRNVLSLKRNRKASGEKKKRYKRINLKSVRNKIDSHRSVPADYKPKLDLSVLESQPPPPGPARVRWAREVAALRTRLRTQKQTSARSLVHGSRAAHR